MPPLTVESLQWPGYSAGIMCGLFEVFSASTWKLPATVAACFVRPALPRTIFRLFLLICAGNRVDGTKGYPGRSFREPLQHDCGETLAVCVGRRHLEGSGREYRPGEDLMGKEGRCWQHCTSELRMTNRRSWKRTQIQPRIGPGCEIPLLRSFERKVTKGLRCLTFLEHQYSSISSVSSINSAVISAPPLCH